MAIGIEVISLASVYRMVHVMGTAADAMKCLCSCGSCREFPVIGVRNS